VVSQHPGVNAAGDGTRRLTPPGSPRDRAVNRDIDNALEGWDFQAGVVQARVVNGSDNRQLIQMRIDLGVLQMETQDRPDGKRPHGFPSYSDYLRHEARTAEKQGKTFVLEEEHCQEADREFVQYYHRRISWLALRNYAKAIADADHTLAFMDFIKQHSPSEDYTQAHEQYRGFVTFQRTQGAAALALEQKNPEAAIDEVRDGLVKLRSFFAAFDAEEQMEEDGMVQHLRKIESSLRQQHGIDTTLQEQLDKAVANEDYEEAARLRDVLRKKQL
jgi:UvrB/uvrC motif